MDQMNLPKAIESGQILLTEQLEDEEFEDDLFD